MNSIIVGFAIASVATAHSAYSYVSRHDGASELGYHHGPHVVAQPVIYSHAKPLIHSYASSGYAPDHQDYHHHPSYKFEYGVKDPKTGDHKSQWEHRDGDVVKGEYTLDEADGTKRVVEYYADDKTGFHATVKKIGHAHHPEVHHQVYNHAPQQHFHEHYPLPEAHHHGYAHSYSNLHVPNIHH